MHYQHPELEVVRAALDYRVPVDKAEILIFGTWPVSGFTIPK